MKVHVVKRAKTSPGNCARCGIEILTGHPYKWFKFRWGSKIIFCELHYPRPSEMTTSDKLARLYAAQEEIEGTLSDREAIITALEDAISTAEEVGSEYESSLENMPEGLQQGVTGEAIREKIDACSAWATELETCKDEIESEEEISPEILGRVQQAMHSLEI